MKNLLKALVVAGVVVLSSCSDSESSSSGISDEILSGTISGESFTAAGGKAFSTTFGEEELVSINITNVAVGCETFIDDYDVYVSTSVAFEEGATSDANVVLWKDGETPLNILGSTVVVDEITPTTITVSIQAESDSDDTVEGQFTVDYCN